jgi:hypothetical protein
MMDQDKVKEWLRVLKIAKYKMVAKYLNDSNFSFEELGDSLAEQYLKDEPKQCTCDFVTVVLRTGCKCGGV